MVTSIRHSTKSLPVNGTAFIDGSEKSHYFTGFLLGDSSTNRTGSVSLSITASDGYIVEALRDYAVPGRIVGLTPPYVSKAGATTKPKNAVTLPRVPFAQRLQDLGVHGPKPFRRLSECVRSNFVVWRGVVDSDGSLTYNGRRPVLILAGSRPVLSDFSAVFGVQNKIAFNKGIYIVHAYGRDAIRIATLLYKNSNIHLHRKYAIAQAWMEGRVYWNGEDWV